MTQEILLVDDDRLINLVHTQLIRQVYPETPLRVLQDARLALKHIAAHPDTRFLVLLDINMPIMNGWQFLDYLHEKYGDVDVKVVVVTSSVNKEDYIRAVVYPKVYQFISKPLKKEHLRICEEYLNSI